MRVRGWGGRGEPHLWPYIMALGANHVCLRPCTLSSDQTLYFVDEETSAKRVEETCPGVRIHWLNLFAGQQLINETVSSPLNFQEHDLTQGACPEG